LRIVRSILLYKASLFDEFVDDEEFVVSTVVISSKPGATHSTPA
jgi:hypothetical protein